METLGKFIFPPGREAKPLQPLSAERVNATRPSSTVSTTPTKSLDENESRDYRPSPQSSPTRNARADLFADYHPTSGSPKAVTGFALPQSPSLPEIHALRSHVRTNSDVQGLVKRFEHLDVRDKDAENSERRKKQEAELRRAQIAREEAESDVKRLREELRHVQKEFDDSRDRERKAGRRIEVLMEDASMAKDSHAGQLAIYEKEIRKAKKEAFQSSSVLVKVREELKSARNTLRITQSGFDLERQKVQRKEQERFEMEYQLIPLQEQVEKLMQRLQVVESERDALKKTVQEEEVARIAAAGGIALPASQNQDDDLMPSPRKGSPRKQAPSPLSDDKENVPAITKKALDIRRLAEELDRERMRREHAEELADFLRMECLFRCCQCRPAGRLNHELRMSLDAELAAGLERIRQDMVEILTPSLSATEDQMEIVQTRIEEVLLVEEISVKVEEEDLVDITTLRQPQNAIMEGDDRSNTMTAEEPTAYPSPDDQLQQETQQALHIASPIREPEQHEEQPTEEEEEVAAILVQPSSPYEEPHATPIRHQPFLRTVTTTTTIPMHFTPVSKPQPFFNPTVIEEESCGVSAPHNESAIDDSHDDAVPATPTFDRAAALAAIEYRRGRAKSIANGQATPRKQMLEGVKERRDISAPALGQKVGVAGGSGGSVKGRSGSAGKGVGRR